MTSSIRSTTPRNFYIITADRNYFGGLLHNRGLRLEIGQLIGQSSTFRRETRVFFAVIDHFLLRFDWTKELYFEFPRGKNDLAAERFVRFVFFLNLGFELLLRSEAFHRSLR